MTNPDYDTSIALVMAAVAIGVAMTLAVALVCMKESRDDALEDRDSAVRRLNLATDLLEEQRRQGFAHVNLAYPADALPDTTSPAEQPADDPWVAEMRERWALDNTSEQ